MEVGVGRRRCALPAPLLIKHVWRSMESHILAPTCSASIICFLWPGGFALPTVTIARDPRALGLYNRMDRLAPHNTPGCLLAGSCWQALWISWGHIKEKG